MGLDLVGQIVDWLVWGLEDVYAILLDDFEWILWLAICSLLPDDKLSQIAYLDPLIFRYIGLIGPPA